MFKCLICFQFPILSRQPNGVFEKKRKEKKSNGNWRFRKWKRERVPRNVGDVWLVNQKSNSKPNYDRRSLQTKMTFRLGWEEKKTRRDFLFSASNKVKVKQTVSLTNPVLQVHVSVEGLYAVGFDKVEEI